MLFISIILWILGRIVGCICIVIVIFESGLIGIRVILLLFVIRVLMMYFIVWVFFVWWVSGLNIGLFSLVLL